jgi:hypothetical protein
MKTEDIEELAKNRDKESLEDLSLRMGELRSNGAGLLQCIIYVKTNQELSLEEAVNFVINSSTWLDRKDDFLQQQEDAFQEFLASSKDSIESIDMTIMPDRTKIRVNMKKQDL